MKKKKGIKSYYGMGKKHKKGIPSYQKSSKKKPPYKYSVNHDKKMVYIEDTETGKIYSESYAKYPDLTQGARDTIMDNIRHNKLESLRKKNIKSYAGGGGAKKFSALEQSVSAPRKIKPEGAPEEELIYANKEEIRMLKEAGGSGTPTPYGVRSFRGQGAESTGSQLDEEQTGWSDDGQTYTYNQSEQEVVNKAIEDSQRSGDDGGQQQQPVNTSETRPYEGDGITLKGLHKAISEGKLQDYLDGFASRTSTSTNSTGGTHTITYEALDHGIEPDMTLENMHTDAEGNIIGWTDSEGQVQFENPDEWYVDSEGNWFYVGTGAVGGAGGEGKTTIIGPDGELKTIGARTYADLLGFDQDVLDQAIQDRANVMTEMKGRQEYYGGKYLDAQGRAPGDEGFDSTTATFKGGKEQEMYEKADKYEEDYGRLMSEAEREGQRFQRLAEDTLEDQSRLARDADFYEGLQRDATQIQKDVGSYRSRIAEMADQDTPRGQQSAMYAMRSEQIDKDADIQGQQLRQMLAERGISPNSPLALKMANQINSSKANQKREARRSALFDAMQMQSAQNQERSALYGQAANLSQGELSAVQQRAGIRGQRLAGLGQLTSQYAGLGQQAVDQRMRMAGMQGAMSSEMFSRGTYFGGQAQQLSNTRLAEAMDRQAGQEYKQLTGMSMDLSKYGMDKQAEIAEKIAAMQSAASGPGSRSSMLGSLIGGAAGYFMSGGNPYMAGLGANVGSNLNI